MTSLKNDIEKIISQEISTMTGQRQQKRSIRINHQFREMLEELYDHDPDPIVFVNHFGHIEYLNHALSRMMMLDKYDKPFTNIYNLDQLAITFELSEGLLHASYPNGLMQYHSFHHDLVHFQKSVLLKLTFKDQTEIYRAGETLQEIRAISGHYLTRLTMPMFLFDAQGIVVHVPDANLKIFDRPLTSLVGESLYEVLPFDYASEIMDKAKKITDLLSGHFMYQTEKDKIITVYDTTVQKVAEDLFLCEVKDVSDLNTMSSTIEYLNSYDSLTGFYNINYYENTLAKMEDSGRLPMGIYTLNLQGLKQVNIRMGYHQCDNLLIEIALNIKSVISQHEIPCRITGDTFIVFFPNCSQQTLDSFNEKMTEFIRVYKEKYYSYYLTYSEKSILIKDMTTDYSTLVKGLMV